MNPNTVLALAAAALLAAGCSKAPPPKADEVRLVRVQKIAPVEHNGSVEFPGEVRPRYETRLGFRVGGKMTERLVEVGSRVRPGQPIARLDPSDLKLALASANAQLVQLETERALAQADLARYRDLSAKNFISQAEFERRQSAFDTAVARLDAAKAQTAQSANQAGYALMVADTAGVITAIEAEAGQVVSAGQTVARIARPGDREVAIAVPESQRALLSNANEYTVTLNAYTGRSWKGRLREVAPMADPATRTYAARITILSAGDEAELGMSARVALRSAKTDTGIELPLAALYSKGDSTEVWLVEAGGSVRLQAVKAGGVRAERVLIESGLKSGDVVVVAGAQLLRPGQRVRVAEGK